MKFPEPGLPQHRARIVSAPSKARSRQPKNQSQPGRDVEVAFLGRLEDVVVGVAFLPDLRRHAVEALRALLRARERHVGDRARDAAVAIVERMDGDEPEMGEGRL